MNSIDPRPYSKSSEGLAVMPSVKFQLDGFHLGYFTKVWLFKKPVKFVKVIVPFSFGLRWSAREEGCPPIYISPLK